jgi:hypothetical protein
MADLFLEVTLQIVGNPIVIQQGVIDIEQECDTFRGHIPPFHKRTSLQPFLGSLAGR